MSFFISFQIFQEKSSDSASQDRKTSRKNQIEREQKSRGASFQSLKKHLTDMSLEMEARREGLSLDKGSSREKWENLFRKVPEAHAIILDSLDLESALACRLVCKEWRVMVNCYKKLWEKVNKVLSITVNLKRDFFLG